VFRPVTDILALSPAGLPTGQMLVFRLRRSIFVLLARRGDTLHQWIWRRSWPMGP